MSSFSNAPHLLTKERLKSALKANGIPLPKTDQKKAFYVDLYLQKLTSQNEESSSGESEEVPESSPMESSKKLPQKLQQKIVINKRVKGGLPFDVTALSDGDLARQLRSLGATVGPINDSTRPLYQKKLAKLLTEELQAPAVPRITKLSPKQTKVSPTKPQRKENVDFSDENDVNDASTDELEVEMVEQLDYNHDQQDQDSLPHKMPPPSYRSTPAKSTPRKRLATRTNTTKQESRKMQNKGEMAEGLEQTDSVEIVAVKKPTHPVQEESSIFGPHVQILLAVLFFLGFTAFLVYYLMEEVPHREITNRKTP